ncbi:MAG: response regulator transcription factor [Spirochaetales bacterium]|nr:response regulator transcription factor [Spirochaetales bacterium]
MKSSILVVEDDPHLLSILNFLLTDEGYAVRTSTTGEEGLEVIKKEHIDLVLLDINLPGIDGLEVCNRIKRTEHIPVIILSCRDQDSDVISGLELGAEDYVRKPFNHRELVLRISRLLDRKDPAEMSDFIETGELLIKKDREEVYFRGEKLALTPMEYKLLEVLGERLDWVLSWQVLLKRVWGYEEWDGGREMVKVNIRRLRKKIEPDPSLPVYLLTERGRGYKLALHMKHE